MAQCSFLYFIMLLTATYYSCPMNTAELRHRKKVSFFDSQRWQGATQVIYEHCAAAGTAAVAVGIGGPIAIYNVQVLRGAFKMEKEEDICFWPEQKEDAGLKMGAGLIMAGAGALICCQLCRKMAYEYYNDQKEYAREQQVYAAKKAKIKKST